MAEPTQGAPKPQYQFNGINSNNSSRGGSPVPKPGPIPSTQLPPVRASIPTSQLPPMRGPVAGLTQRVNQLSVSGHDKFKSSTPNREGSQTPVFNDIVSPVVPNNLETVPLSANSNTVSNQNLVASQSSTVPSSTSASQYFKQSSGILDLQFKSSVQNPSNFVPVVSQSTVTQSNYNAIPPQQNQPTVSTQFSTSQPVSSTVSQPQLSTVPQSNSNAIPSQQNQPAFTSQFSNNQPVRSTVNQSQHPSVVNTQPPGSYFNASQPTTQTNRPSSQVQHPSSLPQQSIIYSQQSFKPPSQVQLPSAPAQFPVQNQQPPKLRYPQPSPANQAPPQFNTGLPPRNSPYQQSNPVVQPQPLPSQRFNPQINYNVGPSLPQNANGPSSLPPKTGLASNRYPSAPGQQPVQQQPFTGYPNQPPSQSGVVQTGFNRLWGAEHVDLLQTPNILPPIKIQAPLINLGQELLNQANCSPDVFRCTVTKIPETASLLQKSRLPLGLLIHPFKDLSYLPIIQSNVIVRCRSCRTYINPFVYFVDAKRWKCNLCFRVNELPEEFQYDPVSKTYGDPSRRPEIKSSTIEYIAPSEYMLRPPQPAVYLFLLDVSRLAVDSGYLDVLCAVLLEELQNLPGDARTQVGFLAYDSTLHFFSLAEGLNQPHEMTILDIDDVFLPTPDALLVNLKDRVELVEDLLRLLPRRFSNTFDGNSALGAALQVAHKMMAATGGRVTVFQAALPNVGPGAVSPREDPNQRSTAETSLLNPINDFYKRLALECSGHQVAVDLFILNSQYVDIATISGISRFSGGTIQHFPLFKSTRPLSVDAFQKHLRRYLTRKIGFEAVMRVRCTRGLTINTFHGNFFVRSPDLLALPNINPDTAFGIQAAIEENLTETQTVCFQAALLYTSSKGERRIRVHTLCLPLATTLSDVIQSADQQCIVGLLSKMAVDRSMQASLSDAREAFINAAIDILTAYKFSLNMGSATSGLLAPKCLQLLPLYIAAILKHPAFRIGVPTRLDDRLKAMIDMKTLPLHLLMQTVYPDLYPVHNLELQVVALNEEEDTVPLPPRLQLSARCLENKGAFLMDCGDRMMMLVGPNVSQEFLNQALGVTDYNSIDDNMTELPILNNLANQRLHQFINYLNDEKPYNVTLQVIRDNSPNRGAFVEKLIEDRLENSLSYHEFLQHLKTQVK